MPLFIIYQQVVTESLVTQQTQKINNEEIQKFDDQNLANRIINKSALQIVKNNVVLQTGACMHVCSTLQLLHHQLLPLTHVCQPAEMREGKTIRTNHACHLASH